VLIVPCHQDSSDYPLELWFHSNIPQIFCISAGLAFDIEPNGPFNLVVTNSRISNSGSGVLIKPAAAGSVTAWFDGVINRRRRQATHLRPLGLTIPSTLLSIADEIIE
jgi:hypothetical protein